MNSESAAAKHALAFEYKKQKKWTDAIQLWESIVGEKSEEEIRLEACIELAKIYEHREKDLQTAFYFTKQAEAVLLKIAISKSSKITIDHQDILKRLERLNKKIYRSF